MLIDTFINVWYNGISQGEQGCKNNHLKCGTDRKTDAPEVNLMPPHRLPRKRKGENNMTDRQLENRIRKMQELEAQQKELDAQIAAITDEIKADLESKGEQEHKTPNFVIRWKEIISSRIDSKSLKADLPDVYARYCRESASRRFTIA